MLWQNAALGLAGVIGSGTAVAHGIVTQRLMVRPFGEFLAQNTRVSGNIRRIVPLLLHFSTAAWFIGGLALIAAAAWFSPEARFATALCIAGLFLFGAIGNLWATRGRHPGWMLLTAALALIGFALAPLGS